MSANVIMNMLAEERVMRDDFARALQLLVRIVEADDKSDVVARRMAIAEARTYLDADE